MQVEPIEIFVDGACRNNGHNNPQAGCGVYWGPSHPLNCAEMLIGDKQTNNRGVLSAAIVAITQAITCKMNWITVITDSKYVKNGITEWIKEWKQNDWKTTKRNWDRDVLNKDLWLILDFLQGQLTVDWCWVEGHKDYEGNKKADDLAKFGTSVETSIWQYTAHKWYEDQHCDVTNMPCDSTSSEEQVQMKALKPQYICKSCKNQCSEEDDAILCQECKFWMHYRCTNLPEYQLYLYECTQRKFTCKFCVDIDDEFSENFNASQNPSCSTVLKNEEINTCKLIRATEYQQVACQTDNNHPITKVCKSITSQTDNHPASTAEKKSSSCQTDRNLQLVDLQELNKSTVSSLQESFVGAFDRINASVRNLKTNIDEENNLSQKINGLLKENERLRAIISQEKPQDNHSEKKCQSCDDFSHRIDKLTKAFEKEKENSQLKLHEITLQKEMQESKMKADASLMQHKIEILNKQLSMQENEVANLEKRVDTKNNLIGTLEEKISELTKKISDLQDEVLSLKLHDCRIVNQQQLITEENDQTKTKEKEDSQATTGREVSKAQYSEVVKETNHRSDKMANKDEEHKSNIPQSAGGEAPKQSNIIRVQVVGTSNTKYIHVSLKYIAGTEFDISKKIKYTLQETKHYFEALESSEQQDAFILQSLCTEITKKSADECSKELTDIIDTIEFKFRDTKVIISLGLPRDDVTLNRKVEKVNILLKESLAGRQKVHLCDNSNLFYRGAAQQGILKEDGLHLSKDGTKLLAKNIRETLYDAFDFPVITYDSRENDTPRRPAKRDSGYEGIKYGQGNTFRRGENSDRLWRDDRRREYDYMEKRRFDDMYQRYERSDDQYRFRGHGMSSRSPRVSDSHSSGHHRRPYAPYYRQTREDALLIFFFFFISTKQSDKSNAYTWRK